MSLYTSIYWTKRAFVVFALIIFICGGFRIFQIVSNSLTQQNLKVSAVRPEMGFGKIDKLNLKSIDTNGFSPSQFRISTTKGNLDVDNLYHITNMLF